MIYEIENLSFSYPPQGRRILDGISLELEQGDVISVLGGNGAGKSTLLGCMLGLYKPQGGNIRLEGRDLSRMSERDIASAVGFVPQSHAPSFGFSVMEFVTMGCAPRIGFFSKPGRPEREAAEAALTELGIEELAGRPYTEISGGERQKAMVARAIVSKPKAVLFDEPTAHLDYGAQLLVLRIIKNLSERGFSVIMTTHNPEHALLLGGKSALLDRGGKLTVGKAESVITRESLSGLYGIDVRLEYVESLGRNACVYPRL